MVSEEQLSSPFPLMARLCGCRGTPCSSTVGAEACHHKATRDAACGVQFRILCSRQPRQGQLRSATLAQCATIRFYLPSNQDIPLIVCLIAAQPPRNGLRALLVTSLANIRVPVIAVEACSVSLMRLLHTSQCTQLPWPSNIPCVVSSS